MANAKISALTSLANLEDGDVFAVVDDPSGSPVTKKVSVAVTRTVEAYSADIAATAINFRKSRNATTGSHTVVQSGDQLGEIAFWGSDGSAFRLGGYILGSSDGTPGASDMPGRLGFYTTPDGSATPVEHMRISQDGQCTVTTNIDSGGKTNLIVTNSSVTAAQTRFSLELAGDAGTGVNKGNVIFATSVSTGWADYEARFLSFYTGASAGSATERLRITTVGNIKIGGTANRATTEGTNQLAIFNGTAPVGTLANGVSLYSAAGELRVMDAGGTSTLLSPHDDENRWVFDSQDTTTGKTLHIDVEMILRFVNDKYKLGYVQGDMSR